LIRYISVADRIVALTTTTLKDSMEQLLDRLVPGLTASAKRDLTDAMLRRERMKPTVLPHKVAFPRAECDEVNRIVCAVGISEAGVHCGNGEYIPAHTLFMTLYPKRRFREFVLVLDHLVRFSQDPDKLALLQKVVHDRKQFQVVRAEVFPWGARDWGHTNVFMPVHGLLERMEAVVGARRG